VEPIAIHWPVLGRLHGDARDSQLVVSRESTRNLRYHPDICGLTLDQPIEWPADHEFDPLVHRGDDAESPISLEFGKTLAGSLPEWISANYIVLNQNSSQFAVSLQATQGSCELAVRVGS